YLRLSNHLVTRDAFRERATVALARAVALDGWRAEIAFKTAEKLPLSALERIRDAAPADPRTGARVYYEFALAVDRRGLTEQALAAAVRAGQINPDFGPAFFRAGEFSRRLGRTEEATAHYRSFVAAREKPLAMEGWALYQLGDLEEANSRFRKAVTEAPDNRWAWEGVMAVAAKRGDDRGEKRAIEQILRLGSENPKLRARLEELKAK
ncbi:MAG TPA: tetratricopeptide repeat protein, partial [Myxococcota bacterium]|nr:tetratricopeptide repeat protein [Myxococcota bacterium]